MFLHIFLIIGHKFTQSSWTLLKKNIIVQVLNMLVAVETQWLVSETQWLVPETQWLVSEAQRLVHLLIVASVRRGFW